MELSEQNCSINIGTDRFYISGGKHRDKSRFPMLKSKLQWFKPDIVCVEFCPERFEKLCGASSIPRSDISIAIEHARKETGTIGLIDTMYDGRWCKKVENIVSHPRKIQRCISKSTIQRFGVKYAIAEAISTYVEEYYPKLYKKMWEKREAEIAGHFSRLIKRGYRVFLVCGGYHVPGITELLFSERRVATKQETSKVIRDI